MQQIFSSLIGPSGPYYADLTGKTAIITGGATGIVSFAPFLLLYRNDDSLTDEGMRDRAILLPDGLQGHHGQPKAGTRERGY